VTRFIRSGSLLESDRFRRPLLGLTVAITLLAAWLAWFFHATVTRYEVSDRARLEVDGAAHAIQSPVAGRVLASHLMLGRQVEPGEVLIELDATPLRLQLREERAKQEALQVRIQSEQKEIAAQEQARAAESDTSNAAKEAARAQVREAAALADSAAVEAHRDALLDADGLIAKRDAAKSKAEAQSRAAAVEGLKLSVDRLEGERLKNALDREANIQRLRGEIVNLNGDLEVSARTAERLENEIQRRRILAPVAGKLGDVPNLRTGAYVAEGDQLAVIVPGGGIKIVAEFLPAAMGRLRPGQAARMRLDGFPWAQYGALRAKVTTVGQEVREGRVRVELTLDSHPPATLPLQHGLPGSVEVELEGVTPATLALGSAGQLLAAPKPVFASAEAAQ
jgi:membrane fusion protein, adhesin transport system